MAAANAKKLVTVIGITGAQGGSVASHLLQNGGFRVRGLTRKLDSAESRALLSRGVELVQGDVGNKADLEKAFEGTWGVFGVTTWNPAAPESDEEKVGRLIADVALSKKAEFLVWSTLADAKTKSGGKYEVEHFSAKYRVEQYIRSLPIKHAFVSPGFYAQNITTLPGIKPTIAADGVVEFSIPIRHDVQLPIVDISDIGLVTTEFFANPDKWSGQLVRLAPEYITFGKVAEVYQKVTGQKARFKPITIEQLKSYGTPHEITDMFEWFNHYGYYGGESLEETRVNFPLLKTFEQFLLTSKWTVAKQ